MNETILYILRQHFSGEALTAEQRQMLEAWIMASQHHEAALHLLEDNHFLSASIQEWDQFEASEERNWQHLVQQLSGKRKGTVVPLRQASLLRKWGWAAASIILVLGIGAYLWITHTNNTQTSAIAQTTVHTAPGSDGAILTLADGRQVVLDSLDNGVIASQNGADVVLNNGLLAYDLTGKSTGAVEYNTIATPNGRQFEVTLPDGTRVWLNAGSSIQYPTVFTAQERRVVVTGEVYMEVAANKSKPFLVSVNDMEVQVLGTSFNINAYNDEPSIKTTLVDGSIKVLKETQPQSGVILQPGQQVVFDEKISINKAVDVEQVIAWKNGVFNFNGATLEEFMRQIARWYDLTIIYEGAIPHRTFKGEMGRDLQLSQIMKLLTQSNIKYQLSGKTITIEPQ